MLILILVLQDLLSLVTTISDLAQTKILWSLQHMILKVDETAFLFAQQNFLDST